MAIAVILIVVVGPKDLPAVLRGIGRTVRKVRGMADEFKKGVDEFIRESELKELQDGVEKVKDIKSLNFDKIKADTERQFNQTLDPMSSPSSQGSSPGALPPVDTSSTAAPVPTTPEAAAGVPQPTPQAPAAKPEPVAEKKDA